MKFLNTWILLCVSILVISCSNKHDMVANCINDFSKFEIGTVEYVVEKAVSAEKETYYNGFDISLGDKKILYSITATLKAGLNLDSFTPSEDIKINGNNITVDFPKAELIVLNIVPESIHYEFSKVSWFRFDFSEAEKLEVLKMGEQSIRESIDKLGILQDAEKNAKEYFESLFSKMGFKHVTINFV